MAVAMDHPPVTEFAMWYDEYRVDPRTGCLDIRNVSPCGHHMWRKYEYYKREMDIRVANYETLEKIADGEVIKPKPDLPNISSGETAGLVRRIARALVQNTPNVDVISRFDDDSMEGVFARHILTSKIIGVDQYSNDMQQNLFASTKTSLTLGFDCVIPVLLQDAGKGWYIKYDAIHYRDVFPEPGCKDVRDATSVFIRRYLTRGEVMQLVRDETPGWDIPALRLLLQHQPRSKEMQSVDHQTKKRHQIPEGYEVVTWYSSSGEPFLTFAPQTKHLLRIEKNKHPLKWHPVHFLVLEKDSQQPLGKSQVELLIGRQDFQDLMLNGAMKLWYRNINPSIIGYGSINAIPNLSPGKYTQISNPNAKIEPFEVNTQTLMQFGSISEQNLASMVSLVGSPDQMAASAGQGMSQTPQGVEAQAQVIDLTTNNYQKAIEAFFSHYCSYALTIYFQELQAVKRVRPTADARMRLLKLGLDPKNFTEDGALDIDFSELAIEYFVRCVPGSLVELEDEKQMRVLNQMFVPLSQAMPAMAATGDQDMLRQASEAMAYIIRKQIELSGSANAQDVSKILAGEGDEVRARDERIASVEAGLSDFATSREEEAALLTEAVISLQNQMSMLRESHGLLLQKLGVQEPGSAPEGAAVPGQVVDQSGPSPSVVPASA